MNEKQSEQINEKTVFLCKQTYYVKTLFFLRGNQPEGNSDFTESVKLKKK